MNTSTTQLDKVLSTEVGQDFGSITIRVVVLGNSVDLPAQTSKTDIRDLEPDEVLDESTSKRPIDGYLESPKRGKLCCVFLVNGQRQHAWDNMFIVRDLELKYLRNRMLVIVDIDGLHPEAIAMLMQGSRHQFYEGEVYTAIARRVIAALKGDPDLIKLEEQAEQEISSLKSGDAVVKAALDQLIDAHHEISSRAMHGHAQQGTSSREDDSGGSLPQTTHMVVEADERVGSAAQGPVLGISPDLAALRFKPGERREFTFALKPQGLELKQLKISTYPSVPELEVSVTQNGRSAAAVIKFVEPEGFDSDQYPIHTTLKVVAMVEGYSEPRIIERPVVIIVPKETEDREAKPPPELLETPTDLRVTSRQPLQMAKGGPDLHVKLRWNGKDHLVVGDPPVWQFSTNCQTGHNIERASFTTPSGGRFELLLPVPTGIDIGENIRIKVIAQGSGLSLEAEFTVDVIAPLSPRRIEAKLEGGSQRNPPYELRYVTKDEWESPNCWNALEWTVDDPGAFQPATAHKPLVLLINQDYGLFAELREELTSRRLAESTIEERKTQYTSHIAYHLWQMHKSSDALGKKNGSEEAPKLSLSEDDMREEIKRVASTLIRLTRLK